MKFSYLIAIVAVLSSVECLINISRLNIKSESARSLHQVKQLKEGLDVKNLDSKDPFEQFRAWHNFILENKLSNTPSVMSLATANEDGVPSNRIVVLNNYDKRGFKFYTDINGRIASEVENNPHASIVFYWESIGRQVIVEGEVYKLSEEEMQNDYSKNSFESQVSSYLNDKSVILKDKQELINEYEQAFKKFRSVGSVPRTKRNVGYILVPRMFEFYQTNDYQLWILNDKIRFRQLGLFENASPCAVKGAERWVIERLEP